MKHLPIIALTGPAGCGKDTIADRMVDQHGYTKLAFADAVREEVCAAFGIHADLLTDRRGKELPTSLLALSRCNDYQFVGTVLGLELTMNTASDDDITAHMRQPRSPRRILQLWGTEFRRGQHGDDYWVSEYAQRLAAINGPVVTPDCRFASEAEFVSMHGGEIWQVYRPNIQAVADHSSEQPIDLDFIDRVIDNRSDIDALHAVTDKSLAAMLRAMREAA